MFNLSSAEGARFAAICQEMTETVGALGPSPLRAVASPAPEAGETRGPAAGEVVAGANAP